MFIKCATLKKKHLFLILFPIFKILGKYIEKKLELYNFFILPFLMSLGNTLCVIFWFSTIKLNQRKNTASLKEKTKSINKSLITDNESNLKKKKRGLSQFEIYIDEINQKNKIKSIKEIFFYIVFGITFFFATLLHSIFFLCISKANKKETILFSLVLRFLIIIILSHFILKDSNYFFRHKIFSFILIMIISMLYIFFNLDYDSYKFDKKLLLLIVSEILYACFYIGGKEYIQFTYKSPFKLVFFVGIIHLVLFIILQIIFIKLGEGTKIYNFIINNLKNDNNKINVDYNDTVYINVIDFLSEIKMKVIFLILLLIIYVINNYFEWQIISFFSPSHLVSSNLLYVIILPFLYEKLSVNIIIFYINFLLIFFFLLVFNEFVILYCCSLEENTFLEKVNKERQYSIQMERISNEYELNNEEANDINIRNSDELNEASNE